MQVLPGARSRDTNLLHISRRWICARSRPDGHAALFIPCRSTLNGMQPLLQKPPSQLACVVMQVSSCLLVAVDVLPLI